MRYTNEYIVSLVGTKFNKLTLISSEMNGKYRIGIYLCDCGNIATKDFNHVKNGSIQSCGCLLISHKKSKNFLGTHGMTDTKEFRAWQAILNRCYNPNYIYFHRYGGRGISVCKRWKNSFKNFFEDMGFAPSEDHTLDRFPNNDGNYELSNCRWATWEQQASNTSQTRWIEHDGYRMTLTQWSEHIGVSVSWLHTQLKTKVIADIVNSYK